jgi:DNA-binding transcriptional regulator YiaG
MHRHIPKLVQFLGYDPFPRPTNLGERLRSYRRVHGLTQRELAKRMGIVPSTLAKWETAQKKPAERFKKCLQGIIDN